MRHPAAPTIIAVLLGFLAFMVLWARWRGDGHHEGNPHPHDLPLKRNLNSSPQKPRSKSPSNTTGSSEEGLRDDSGDDSTREN
jgi:hypothetical protein